MHQNSISVGSSQFTQFRVVIDRHTDTRPRYVRSNRPHRMLCIANTHTHTHTHTTVFNGFLSGTTRVGRYQKKPSPTHTHPDHRTSFINFLHLQRSTASSLFSLRALQSSRTTSLQVLFGLPLGLGPSTSYSVHFFAQSSSSFRSTCPYQRSLFCCNTNVMSSIYMLCLAKRPRNLKCLTWRRHLPNVARSSRE